MEEQKPANKENKFNFSEEDKQNQTESNKAAVKKDAAGLFASISRFLSELGMIRIETPLF